ncbi:MAG: ABC transporter permease [Methylobacteriaceae bacterium]|nr:ABC transporter permease [Methylobacteriaceae bacterium]
MMRFVIKRVVQAGLTIAGVLTVGFVLIRAAGDPVALLLPENATADDAARMRAALGLDLPLWRQYLMFMADALRGDLGMSFRQQTSAVGLVLERLPATMELALAAFAIGVILAFGLDLTLRVVGSQRLRHAVLWVALTRQAIPTFWFGLLMILLFSVTLRWLPALGRGTPGHLILPAFTLGTYELALYLRLLESSFREQETHDYVRTAYAKGLGRGQVVLREMLPNVLLPMVTVAGLNLGVLLGGTVVTETVFSWPGVGRLIVQAVSQRDYPVVVAGVLMTSLIFVALNLLVDLLYAVLDPRVRLA